MTSNLPPPNLTHLFRMELEVGVAREIGQTIRGRQRVVSISGGQFAGSKLRGEVLPGADCITEYGDGTIEVDVRVPLLTTDGQCILMRYKGYRHGPITVIARLANGEVVDPIEYYFRIRTSFEVAAGKYEWLGKVVAIGTGHRGIGKVSYEIYAVD